MPPAALISSTAIFMPLETGTPQTLIGPDRSWWVPITISVAEMPSLVTLVWAAAGRWVSARALTAMPSALNDFDIAVSSSLARVERRVGPFNPSPFSNLSRCSSHRPVAIHGVDLDRVALVHEIPLQLHGRRQFLVLRRQLAFDQEELLDGFDPREIGVHRLDLAHDQILDLSRSAQALVIGKGNCSFPGVLLDSRPTDHTQAGTVTP